jgi:predicted nucleic acid-binding protein
LILADTSAWVEYLRRTGSDVNVRMRELIAEPNQLVVTDAVLMELLAGERDPGGVDRLRRLLRRCVFARTEAPLDYESAAAVYRACRRAGYVVGSQLDCLVAAVAIRTELPLLHADRDFDAIAAHTALTIA